LNRLHIPNTLNTVPLICSSVCGNLYSQTYVSHIIRHTVNICISVG